MSNAPDRMPPKLHVLLNGQNRLEISALRNRGPGRQGGLHFALQEWAGDGWDTRVKFVVPRGMQLDKFFAVLEQVEADARACGWWPSEDAA